MFSPRASADDDDGFSDDEPMELELLDELDGEYDEEDDRADDNDEDDDANGDRSARVRESSISSLIEDGVPPADDDADAIDAPNDERFLRIVLQHAPFEATAPERTAMWVAIAGACIATGGLHIVNRVDVTRRLGVLTTALIERPHLLSPELRAMVVEFNERNYKAGYAARLGGNAFLDVLRRSCASGQVLQVEAAAAQAYRLSQANEIRKKAAEDEQLMEFVMQLRPFEAEEDVQQALWMNVLTAVNAVREDRDGNRNGAFVSKRSIILRVRAATSGLLDAWSFMYLPPALRAMLVEFHLLTVDSPHDTSSSRWEIALKSSPVSSGSDEAFVRMVLAKRPFDAKGRDNVLIWEAIAGAVGAASGVRLTMGAKAKGHMRTLTKAMLSHPRSLRPGLRTLILEYNELIFKGHGSQSIDETSLERLRRNVHLDGQSQPHTTTVPSLSSSHASGTGIESNRQRIKVGEDERLLRLYTKYRSARMESTAMWKKISDSYNASIGGMKTVRGPLKSIDSGRARLQSAANALANPTSAYHTYLPSALRATLIEFVKEMDRSAAKAAKQRKRQRSKTKSARAVQANPVEAGKCDEPLGSIVPDRDEAIMRKVLEVRPFWAHTARRAPMWESMIASASSTWIRTGSDLKKHMDWLVEVVETPMHLQRRHVGSTLLGLLKDYMAISEQKLTNLYSCARSKVKRKGTLSVLQLTFDDIILHEALQIAPDWSDDGWNVVAERLNTRLKATLFRNGHVCNNRVQELLVVARSTTSHPLIKLSEQQKELLQEFEAATTGRRTICVDETASATADNEDSVPRSLSVTSGKRRDCETSSSQATGEHCHVSQSKRRRVAEDDNADHDFVDQDDGEIESRVAFLPIPNFFNSADTSSHHTHTTHHEELLLPLVGHADLVAEIADLRQQVTKLLETRNAANSMNANSQLPQQRTPTNDNVFDTSATRHDTANLLEACRREREEYRAHQQTLVAMLQDERAAQRRETKALLAAIDRERQDRRDEFIAMANLMTRSLEPVSPTTDKQPQLPELHIQF